MKVKYYVFVILTIILIKCKSKGTFKQYIHRKAGFKITVPIDWNKTREDSISCEFRDGLYKMVEVAIRNLNISPERLKSFSEDEFLRALKTFAFSIIEGYWFTVDVRNYEIVKQRKTVLGGITAYYVKTKGYHRGVREKVIIDLVTTVDKEKAKLYLFLSQVIESEYPQTKTIIDSMIKSFQILK